MKGLKFGLVALSLFLTGFAANGMASETQSPLNRTGSFLQGSTTTSQSAVFAAFLSDVGGPQGTSTSLSVSNLGGRIKGGADREGFIKVELYNTLGTMMTLCFDTSTYKNIGTGLNADGKLGDGKTWLVNLRQLLNAIGFQGDFAGYAFVIGLGIDELAGTATNNFKALGVPGPSYVMEPAFGGQETSGQSLCSP